MIGWGLIRRRRSIRRSMLSDGDGMGWRRGRGEEGWIFMVTMIMMALQARDCGFEGYWHSSRSSFWSG